MSAFSARGGPLTREQIEFNKDMSRGRISVENIFGIVVSYWSNLEAQSWRLGQTDPADWLVFLFLIYYRVVKP